MHTTTIARAGALTAATAAAWGVTTVVSPSSRTLSSQAELIASGVFQLGLLALLGVMWATAATGTGRSARTVLAVELVALVLAIGWTVPFALQPNRNDGGVLGVLDFFWPLSMLGTLVVGAMVAKAGRWPSPVRYLPLAAGLILLIDGSLFWAPEHVRLAAFAIYLILTYGATGLALARQAPDLAALSTTPTRTPAPAGR